MRRPRLPGYLPSRRLLWLLAAAALPWLLGVWAGIAADAVVLVLAVADAVAAPAGARLRVERDAPERISLGADGEVRVTLAHPGGARALRVQVTDDLPPLLERQGADVLEARIPAGREASVRYTVHAARRGDAVYGDVHLRVLGPMGLVWRQSVLHRADALRVQPGVLEVKRYRLLGLRNRLHEAGFRPNRQRGEGGAFESLREYVTGDDPRTMDWKASARRGVPMVRQYEVERRQNVLLAIDAGRLMTQKVAGRERIDFALASALLLADVAALHGDQVGLLVFADRVQQYIPPSRTSLSQLADALGQVQARMVEPNYPAAFTYLARQLRRRSLLVMFSDVIDATASSALVAHLGRAAGRHLPLAVALRNPELEATAALRPHDEAGVYRRAAAEELLQVRAHALAAMQRSGVLVADARPQDAVPAVVNRYLDVKRRGLL